MTATLVLLCTTILMGLKMLLHFAVIVAKKHDDIYLTHLSPSDMLLYAVIVHSA